MTLLLFFVSLAAFGPLLITLAYFLGQFANFALHATSVIASDSLNVRHIDSMGKYFAFYWPKLLVRFLWNTVIVIVVAVLPKLFFPSFDLDVRIQGLTPGVALLLKCAAVCAAGLAADAILKKFQDVAKSKGVDLSDSIPSAPGQTTILERNPRTPRDPGSSS